MVQYADDAYFDFLYPGSAFLKISVVISEYANHGRMAHQRLLDFKDRFIQPAADGSADEVRTVGVQGLLHKQVNLVEVLRQNKKSLARQICRARPISLQLVRFTIESPSCADRQRQKARKPSQRRQ